MRWDTWAEHVVLSRSREAGLRNLLALLLQACHPCQMPSALTFVFLTLLAARSLINLVLTALLKARALHLVPPLKDAPTQISRRTRVCRRREPFRGRFPKHTSLSCQLLTRQTKSGLCISRCACLVSSGPRQQPVRFWKASGPRRWRSCTVHAGAQVQLQH